MCVSTGTTIEVSVSNNLNCPSSNMSSGIIYDSNSTVSPVSETKSEYSYFQYHCNPTTLIVIAGVNTSSLKYNKIKLGKAINNKIIAGKIVQIISNVCPCLKYLYANL